MTDEEVKEVEAKPKTAEEQANLKILLHRTPEGVGASGDIRGRFKYEIVSLPKHMYPNQAPAASTTPHRLRLNLPRLMGPRPWGGEVGQGKLIQHQGCSLVHAYSLKHHHNTPHH